MDAIEQRAQQLYENDVDGTHLASWDEIGRGLIGSIIRETYRRAALRAVEVEAPPSRLPSFEVFLENPFDPWGLDRPSRGDREDGALGALIPFPRRDPRDGGCRFCGLDSWCICESGPNSLV